MCPRFILKNLIVPGDYIKLFQSPLSNVVIRLDNTITIILARAILSNLDTSYPFIR